MYPTQTAAIVRARIEQESGPLPTPILSYWLCGTPRSGSNLVRHSLRKAGCGHPAEGYHKYANRELKWGFNEKDFIQYNRQMIAKQTSPETGIFGLKIFWEQFQFYQAQCDQLAVTHGQALNPYEKVALFFPDAKFIFLRRRDKLRQAISLVKAKQSGAFIIADEKMPAPAKPPRLRYNARMISYYLSLFAAQDMLWQHFFQQGQLSPHTIWYEDLVLDFKPQVRSIYQFLGTELRRVGKLRFKKQADQTSEEWYRRYLAENPWVEDPTDTLSLLANGQLRSLRAIDAELSVSAAIWFRRLKHLARNPLAYLQRLRHR